MRTSSKPLSFISAGVAGALALAVVPLPAAHAQSSLSSSSSGTPAKKRTEKKPWVNVEPPKKTASSPMRMLNGTTIQIMDDVLGKYSEHTGFRTGDLGTMAPISDDEFAMIFGDSFRGDFGNGWMSPVGVVATKDEDGFIKIVRPIDNTSEVTDMISYHRVGEKTLIPSDVINIGGVLYMQGTWHAPLGTVLSSQVWKSTDQGKSWSSVASTPGDYLGGLSQLISWEKGPDGYIYATGTKFGRNSPVFLFRFEPEDIGKPANWEVYSRSSGEWGKEAESILDRDVRAGEMNLRYIDGHWVLVMFNEETQDVEVRISETLERNWNDVRVATVAHNGPWEREQTPLNWSQPYGGYIVPGSHLDDMDIVVSQWNTTTNSRYTATQFNVKGLDKLYGIDADAVREEPVVEVLEPGAEETPDVQAEDDQAEDQSDSSGSSSTVRTLAIILGVLAGVGAIGAATLPLYKDMLPPQLQAMLP